MKEEGCASRDVDARRQTLQGGLTREACWYLVAEVEGNRRRKIIDVMSVFALRTAKRTCGGGLCRVGGTT